MRRMTRNGGPKLIAENRRARYEYELLDRFEAGIVLQGTEVKSLRDGRVSLAGLGRRARRAVAARRRHRGLRGRHPCEPRADRPRKLLLHRGEIDSLIGKVTQRGRDARPARCQGRA